MIISFMLCYTMSLFNCEHINKYIYIYLYLLGVVTTGTTNQSGGRDPGPNRRDAGMMTIKVSVSTYRQSFYQR